jgi:3-deoxy-D-manno-octulosonate 8-phosphate phosphatase KdsC-like HAD superfamily phosphatase
MGYIGDDVFDIGIMKKVGWQFCPRDADFEVKRLPNMIILDKRGGSAVLMRLYELLVLASQFDLRSIERIKRLDRNEKS